jgi:ligand-binding sensor domain-containing protein/signal transduction histidine kinase
MTTKSLIAAAVFSFCTPAAGGGTSSAAGSNGPFANQIINIESIPSPAFGKVFAIFRDNAGVLWFGTSKGLYKYDGYEVHVFEIAAPKYEGGRLVTSILQYSDSALLLGTWKGLWIFDLSSERAAPFAGTIAFGDGRITSVVQDQRSVVWIGTMSGGVYSFDRRSGTVSEYSTADGLCSSEVNHLSIDRSGILWVGTRRGLNSLDPNTGHIGQYRSDPGNEHSLSSDEINVIHEDGHGTLWVGTHNGLNAVDRSTERVQRHFLLPGVQNEILAIADDPSGRLWFGVSGAGLFTLANGAFARLTTAAAGGKGISDSYITSLCVDPASSARELLLWIGARDGGIDKIRMMRNPFMNLSRNDNWPVLGTGAVLSLREDSRHTLWVGLWGGGLNALRKKGGKYSRVARYSSDPGDPSGLPNNNVASICEDRTGALWAGTYDGLAVLHPGERRFTVFRHIRGDSTSLPSSNVSKVYADRSGRVWAGTTAGLSLLISGSAGHFENFLHRPQDAHLHGRWFGGNIVSDIAEDTSGHIWAAMYGGGVNRIEDDGHTTRFLYPSDPDGTHENWVSALHADRDGALSLHSAAGFLRLDPSTGALTRVPIPELDETHVFDVYDDWKGFRWISMNIGLVRLDLRTGEHKRFDASLGFPFNELTSQFCATGDGRLLVGALNGFTEFRPDSMTTSSPVPAVVITGFSIFDRAMPAGLYAAPEIRLSHDQNFISLTFAALDFADSRKNSYAYRMAGLDTGWVYAGHRNYAIYTNIDPGEYNFQVRGSNSDQVWNEAGASVRISVAPPYWHAWWFRSAAAAALLALMYAGYTYRMRHVLQLERLRLRIASDLHDDVGSNLSAIAMVSRTVRRSPELSRSTRDKIGEIYSTAVLTSESMKDLVWLIKPENDSFDDLYVRMKETASMLLGDTACSFRIPKTGERRGIPIDLKRSAFLAFKEAVTNIARHAAASSVEIDISLENGMFAFTVRDNGKGFAAEEASGGNGLGSLRRRAAAVGGTCAIASEPGGGTTVRFSGRL